MNTVPTGVKLAPAQESPKAEAIKKTVTRKLYGHQVKKKTLHQQINATGVDVLLEAWHGVWMIFPAIVIGIMSGIGAAFEIGTKKALETYRGK